MGFKKLVNTIVFLEKYKNRTLFENLFSQTVYKPGSVIKDVISLGLNSHLSSSG